MGMRKLSCVRKVATSVMHHEMRRAITYRLGIRPCHSDEAECLGFVVFGIVEYVDGVPLMLRTREAQSAFVGRAAAFAACGLSTFVC